MTAEAFAAGSPRNGPRRSVSHILLEFGRDWPKERVALGEIVSTLNERSYGLLLILFALPNLVPIYLPGLSAVLGLPLAFIALQMILGRSRPWLPQAFLQRSISREDYARVIGKALPALVRVERVLKPRLSFLTVAAAERLIGGFCLVLSLLLVLPIPLTNIPLALPLALFGLALVERDGLCALAATVLGLGAVTFATIAGWAVFKAVWAFLAALAFGAG